ncbi:UNVERIFIED_CONTAM: ribosomal protein S6--L-glutamate ligase/gamma-F420-2:alpha-L-glutamate ligase [Acetivibrio alkalicellulosi]
MITGWLVVNHFVSSNKFLEIYEWLQTAGEKQGINLIKKTNVEIMCGLYEPYKTKLFCTKPDFVLFWDKDIKLARFLEKNGLRLFNCADSIEICDDKALTHINLLDTGIKMPKTIIGPKIFRYSEKKYSQFIDMVVDELGFPLIVKECFGSFGQQVHLTSNYDEVYKLMNNIGERPVMFQEFISSSCGKDIRINVVGETVVAAMYRYNDNDFRANITNGAKMIEYIPDAHQIELAVKVCKTLNLDFAGVDILFGENNEPILCEVNSNAHFKSIYDCTGVNVADFILSDVVAKVYQSSITAVNSCS